jgi:hypothetical protein
VTSRIQPLKQFLQAAMESQRIVHLILKREIVINLPQVNSRIDMILADQRHNGHLVNCSQKADREIELHGIFSACF